MLQTKRKIKRNKKKKKFKVLFLSGLLLFFLAFGLYLYITNSKIPLFLSPLPPDYTINSQNEKDQSVEILKKKLKEKNIEFDRVSSNDTTLTIHLKNKSVIIFSRDREINTQIASLQFILARLTMEGKSFDQLDFRFDKPVIRLK